MDKPVRTLLFLKQPPQACVCNLNESAEPMHMNHPAQTFFGPYILMIYIFGCYKHNPKLHTKLQNFFLIDKSCLPPPHITLRCLTFFWHKPRLRYIKKYRQNVPTGTLAAVAEPKQREGRRRSCRTLVGSCCAGLRHACTNNPYAP